MSENQTSEATAVAVASSGGILDERDAAILAERIAKLDSRDDFRCGDYVRFPDGRMERVSFVAPREWGDMHGVQTSTGGSWYLGDGYSSFSGSLNDFIPAARLKITDEIRPGSCWFFHHDYWTAGGGVDVEAPFRVYELAAQS